MANWIEPLNLETWIVQVFAGTPEIFTAISLIIIISMCAFFRMNKIGLFFIIGVFLLMFAGYITPSFLILMGLIGGLLIGYWISKLVK